MIVIYMATCAVTGKSYIGQTSQRLTDRWSAHVREANLGLSQCRVFHAAIRRHGAAAFIVKMICRALDRDQASALERALIAAHGTIAPGGYNLAIGGYDEGGMLGRRHSAETKAKMRAAALGKPKSPQAVANMRRALSGRKLAPAHAAKIRKIGKGNRGKRHSEVQALAHRIWLYKTAAARPGNGISLCDGPRVRTKKWRAGITIDGKRHNLGCSFATAEEAQAVRDQAMREHIAKLEQQLRHLIG
jgi:group I intron endonuclease